jgi:hypothetical protein
MQLAICGLRFICSNVFSDVPGTMFWGGYNGGLMSRPDAKDRMAIYAREKQGPQCPRQRARLPWLALACCCWVRWPRFTPPMFRQSHNAKPPLSLGNSSFPTATPSHEPGQRILGWKLLRATTRDGGTYDNQGTMFEQAAAWTDHLAMASNGDSGEYLALKLKVDSSGFAYTAFFTSDGRRWQEAETPVAAAGNIRRFNMIQSSRAIR